MKGLKFGTLNVNGLHGKFEEIKSFLMTFSFHLFSLSELRLGEGFKDSFYSVPNYTFLPFLTSNKTRGGSAFYVRDDCNFREV